MRGPAPAFTYGEVKGRGEISKLVEIPGFDGTKGLIWARRSHVS